MKRKNKKIIHFISTLHAGIIFLFLYLPIIVVVIFSFNKSKLNIVFTGFTLEWYGKILKNSRLIDALENTLIIAFVSTILAVIIGTLAAVGMNKFKFKGKNMVDSLLYIPVVIPEIVFGIALLAIFSTVKLKLGLGTLIVAHTTFCIPFVVFTVRARLVGIDRHIEEAAMDLGAKRGRTFFEVLLPSIMPGVASGALLSLTLSMDDVIISFFTAGPQSTTLPIQIYSMVKSGISPDVNALSTIILLVTIGVVILSQSRMLRTIKNVKSKDQTLS